MSVFDVAVHHMAPMAILELLDMGEADRDRMLILWTNADVVDVLAGSGDNIMHGAVRKATKAGHREAGSQLATFARAVAAASFKPGGVRLFDVLWCGTHLPLGSRALACEGCLT